jgi:hypothetical protein
MRLSLRSLAPFALICTAAAVPALAQPQPSAPADPVGVSQYAACAGKPTAADTEAAHGAYMAGKGSFDEADYTTAINYFKDAYRRDCTKNELLVIIARAFELQGNRREAVHALETYLERVPTAQDAEVQRRHIANLKREIIEQPPPVVSASASAAPSAAASAPALGSAVPAPSESVPSPSASSAPPPAAAEQKHSIAPWVLMGVGIPAALITGGVLYGVGSGQVSNAEQVCGTSHTQCPKGSPSIDQGNSGRSNETAGVLVAAIGAPVVLAGGLLWHFLEPTGPDAPKTGRATVTPQIGPGYAGVGVGGQF